MLYSIVDMKIGSAIQTPVVLFAFNRPETTRRVWDRIAASRPALLFLVTDGPRPNNPQDELACRAVREIIENIRWDCKVETNYSSVNLGVKDRINSGLAWVFSKVEYAVILEDDCLPDVSFFYFCQELLERYRYDQRVMMIGGTNYQFGRNPLPYSYYFSLFPHIWGWATWRRAWRLHDPEMGYWPEIRERGDLRSILPEAKARRYWTKRFQATYDGQILTWDYPWVLTCWLQRGFAITPSINLVSNIGFGKGAVHTIGRRNRFANMKTKAMEFPLVHPPYLLGSATADRYTQRTVFRDYLFAPLKRRLKLLLRV